MCVTDAQGTHRHTHMYTVTRMMDDRELQAYRVKGVVTERIGYDNEDNSDDERITSVRDIRSIWRRRREKTSGSTKKKD